MEVKPLVAVTVRFRNEFLIRTSANCQNHLNLPQKELPGADGEVLARRFGARRPPGTAGRRCS
jgi:hypothetical protein